jgi:methyltransferase-like protein
LEKVNEPLYFWQFVQRADAHGLRYLGEADFSSMFANNLREGVASTLERITQDIIQMEQYLDFVRNRTFRQTLLCHAENSLKRTIGPESIERLSVASRLTPVSDQLDARSADPARFSNSKVTIETNSRIVKAALIHLADTWPAWVPFRLLLHAARSQIRSDPVQDAKCIERDGQELGEQLIQFYASGAVELHAADPQFTLQISERPVASPLARLQAESSAQVTNRRSETITLAEMSWHAVQLMDGSKNFDEILDALVELVDKNVLVVQTDGKQVRDLGEARTIMGEAFQRELVQLSKCALLVG